jgi:hypothetical protein
MFPPNSDSPLTRVSEVSQPRERKEVLGERWVSVHLNIWNRGWPVAAQVGGLVKRIVAVAGEFDRARLRNAGGHGGTFGDKRPEWPGNEQLSRSAGTAEHYGVCACKAARSRSA